MLLPHSIVQPPKPTLWAAVVLLLLTFALRIYALDSRPLWWDEGLSLTYAYLPPVANVELAVATEHLNPPLYNWMIGVITYLSGITLFTGRLASVYGGLVTAAAVYGLAKIGFGRIIGLLSLLLMAIAPMQIYHSQEAKGYTVETAALLIALFCWLKIHSWATATHHNHPPQITSARWPWWAGYAGATLLAMGTNYLAIFALLVFNLLTLAASFTAVRRGADPRQMAHHWVKWLAWQAIGIVPLVPYVWASLGSSSQGLENTSIGLQTLSPLHYLWFFLQNFIMSERAGGQVGWWLTSLIVLLAGIGMLAQLPRRPQMGQRLTMVWLLIPLALGYLFHLQFAWFFPRYLLYIQPALAVLAAIGLVQIASSRLWPLAGLGGAAVLFLSAPVLVNHYQAPSTAVEDYDWPPLFEQMQPHVRQGDVLIARTSWLPGYAATYLPPTSQPTWVLGYFEADTIDATLANLLATHGRIWQIDYQISPLSEHNDSAVWMRGRAAMAYSEQIGVGAVTLFVDVTSLPATPAEPVVSIFENGVHLKWQAITATAAPGDVVGLEATWWTDQPLNSRLVRFLHVVNSTGHLVVQADSEPVMGSRPTYTWGVNEPITDPLAITLPPDLPAGQYTLQLGLYDRDSLMRLPLQASADSLVIGQINVREQR